MPASERTSSRRARSGKKVSLALAMGRYFAGSKVSTSSGASVLASADTGGFFGGALNLSLLLPPVQSKQTGWRLASHLKEDVRDGARIASIVN